MHAPVPPVPGSLPPSLSPELAELSPSLRLSPPSRSVLVLGLPDPSPINLVAVHVEIAPPFRPVAALREPLVALAVPEIPASLPPLASTKPAIVVAAGPTASTKTSGAGTSPAIKAATNSATPTPAPPPSPQPATPSATPRPATQPASSASASGAQPVPTRPAPAAPQAAPAAPGTPLSAIVEAIPSYPPSLAPWIDIATLQPQAQARQFSVEIGQKVEVPFTGTGWTYLGEKDGKEGVLYDSRRFEGKGALFTIATSRAGEYGLRFMKQDLQAGTTSEETVRLTVLPRVASPATGSPPIPSATPTAIATPAPTASPAPSTGTVIGTTGAAAALPSPAQPPSGAAGSIGQPARSPVPTAPESPEALLASARTEYGAGRAQGVFSALDRYLQLYPAGEDEAYWLYGQALELNGPLRDIRKAYSMYKTLLEGWPRSAFWNQAQDRVSYIERHYLDIR